MSTLFGSPATPEASGAVLSDDGVYRYRLWRRWGNGPAMTFIMLNPSADAHVDDPTIRRCVGFARRARCEAIEVVNLFAYRATKPVDLHHAHEPRGKMNAYHVRWAIEASDGPVVAAWGAWFASNRRHGAPLSRIAPESIAHDVGKQLWCLGRTKSGAPRHPLYVPADTPLEVFS